MDLGRAIAKHAKDPLYGWDEGLDAYVPLGIKGGLQVYDRFISDRSFGQKKRNLLTPWDDTIDTATYEFIKVGPGSGRFMVESVNQDTYGNSHYNNTYLIHEAPFTVQIGKYQGTPNASGFGFVDGEKSFVADVTTYGDYDRYSALNSKEFNEIDFTIINLYLPLKTEIDTDAHVLIDNNVFSVNEISRVNNILVCRCQQVGMEETGGVAPLVCSATIDFDESLPAVIPGSGTFTPGITLTHNLSCETLLVQLTTDSAPTHIGIAAYDAVLGEPNPPPFDISYRLYNSAKDLIAKSTGSFLSYSGNDIIDGTNYLAITPEGLSDLGDIFHLFDITVP